MRLATIVAGTSLFCTAPAFAAANDTNDSAARAALQQQIDQLKTTLDQLKADQGAQPSQASAEPATDDAETSDTASATSPAPADEAPKKSLTLGGAYTLGYKLKPDLENESQDRGDGVMGITAVNWDGQYGKLTYAGEYRWSQVAFADDSFLRYGWAAYDFTPKHQLKAGLFQVPFGNLRFGYQSFWGNLNYFAGFTDNQAAGIGYKYENGPFRLDIDAFKNDDLQQHSLYGSNPFEGYQQINGGNMRAAWTFNKGSERSVQVSAAVRGGQLEVGDSNDNGTRWAATAAVDAALGNWTLQGQYVDYRYNIPDGRQYNGFDLPTDSITVENYGFGYQMPASGQIFSGNIARTFDIGWGALESIQLYDNYAYLMTGGDGRFESATPGSPSNMAGDIQFNAAGMNLSFGPLQIWLDVLSGKNSAMAFNGPNDGDWNTRYNLQMGLYFAGDVIKR
ncbi:hypothetical protein D3260_08380 [Salinisphaera sp. Q1T1-3]|nr:hypothetical protein D3260_08380 [Salinisphaera sp. Q1T1-3]